MRRNVSERAQFSFIELIVGVAPADQGANRSADNDVGRDAMLDQRVNDPDMGKAARRPAAQNKPDQGPAGLPLKGLGSNVCNRH